MVPSMMVPSPTLEALRRGCCSACNNEGHGGCKRMEKKVAHGGCDSCFTQKGRRRIGLGGILKFIKGNFVFFLYVIGCQLKCVGCRENQPQVVSLCPNSIPPWYKHDV